MQREEARPGEVGRPRARKDEAVDALVEGERGESRSEDINHEDDLQVDGSIAERADEVERVVTAGSDGDE